MCIQKSSCYRQQEQTLSDKLELKSSLLQCNPLSDTLQQVVLTLRSKLVSFESQKIEGQKIRSRAHWQLYGDRLSANFFNAVRKLPKTSSITELRDSLGILRHNRHNIKRICTDFYNKLYATEAT